MADIIKVSGNQALNTEHLRDKTLAHWVAMNQIAQLQLSRQWPAAGKKSGSEAMGWHEWHWQSIVSETRTSRPGTVNIRVMFFNLGYSTRQPARQSIRHRSCSLVAAWTTRRLCRRRRFGCRRC